jgi:flagella basal body P-ring formation protein FlgA
MNRKECETIRETARAGVGQRLAWTAVAAALSACPAARAEPASVRIWPSAVVDDAVVRLSDSAQIAGGIEGIESVEVATAPEAGGRLVLRHEEILDRLRAAGVNVADLRVSGSMRCEVSRAADGKAGDAPRHETVSIDEPTHQDEPATAPPRDPQTLGGAVEGYIRAALAEYGREVEIQFNRSEKLRSALSLSAPRFSFEVEPHNAVPLGLVSLRVSVFEGGELVQTVPVVAEVALIRRVVVAKRPVNRGMAIGDGDVSLELRRFSDISRIGVTDPRAVVGQRARVFVDRGEMVLARDVEPLPLVSRGDFVTVYHRQGGLLVKTVGKALGGGSYGDTIPVKNEGSKRSYEATITGPQTVEVRAAVAPDIAEETS